MSDTVTRPSIPRLTGQTIIFSATGNNPAHDSLPLPDTDKTVGEVDTETLRGIFAKFGIENAWTDGRAAIVNRWADFIGEVYGRAGQAAVRDFLKERRRYE
jgi:hypothetical protein